MNPHPLDRPVWLALTTRQAPLALGDRRALRLAPDYGVFAAAADDSAESQAALADLCPAGGGIALVELNEPAPPPGLTVIDRGLCWQMLAETLTPGDAAFPIAALGEADAAEMFELATLTRPGPFFARTHQLGEFVGVRVDGHLAAMAGERMQAPGFTEVSGVCTHPDHRGHGFAAGLTRRVASRILARGETPFLHVYETNTAAIRVYQALGFKLRRKLKITVLVRGAA